MARTKVFKINISDEQKEKLRQALKNGSPLTVALSYARIPVTLYYYYVEVANVSAYFKERELLKYEEEMIKSGVSLADVKQEAEELNSFSVNRNGAINTFKEPSAKAIFRYKNNRTFKNFADEVYDMISEFDNLRSEAVLLHLSTINKSAGKRGVNTTSSQWFLERTMPEHFGRVDKTINKSESQVTINNEGEPVGQGLPPIKVEFIDPTTEESKNRVREMEKLVHEQLNGKEVA